METQLIQSGGIQQIAAIPQIIYLDFDGELTSYNGEILTIDNVTVEDSNLTEERIQQITAALNQQFAGQNVRFVSDKSDLSDQSDYSTIYIGKTSSFEPYGNFAGLAETVDSGNKNKKDKAFVMLDSTNDNAQIIATIAHEAGHLIGTLDHDGEGLQKYAAHYNVSSGVTSSGIVLNRDSMYVSSGGTANSTTVNGGYLYVFSGGYLYVFSGGVANSTTVNRGGSMSVSSGGTATDIVASNGACLGIAVASDTYIQGASNGSAFEMKNAYISGYTVNSGGDLYVYSGGTTNSTTVDYGGDLYVYSGGTALAVRENGGCVSVGNNANVTFLSNTIDGLVLSNRSATVHSGTTANGTTVNSYGKLDIFSGGTANSTTVNSNCKMYISSGGTALLIKENGGYVGIASGADITFVSNCFSGLILHNSATVHSGTTANCTTVDCNGNLNIYSDGVANNTIINSSGTMHVYEGTANSTTVNQSGYLYVWGAANYTNVNSGGMLTIGGSGVANSTTIAPGGSLCIYSHGSANGTILNFCSLSVSAGGVVKNTIINSGGSLAVCYNGSAIATTVNQGGVLDVHSCTALSIKENGGYVACWSGNISFESNSFSGLIFSSGQSATLHSGTTANNVTIESGGRLYFSGGVANDTVVCSGGDLFFTYNPQDGGTANRTTLNFCNTIGVRSGCEMNDTTVNGCVLWISGGTANRTILNSGAYLNQYCGNVNSTTINSGGRLNVFYGKVDNTIVNAGGSLFVSSYGRATNIVWTPCNGVISAADGAVLTYASTYSGVYYGNSQTLLSSAMIMSGKDVSGNACSMYIMSGGTANNTMVNSGGNVYISNGGTANSVTVDVGGSIYVSSGGTALSIKENGGYVFVDSDASATFIANNFSGLVLSQQSSILHSGTTAVNTIVTTGGELVVSKGGVAEQVIVSNYAALSVSSGGTATDVNIDSKGYLNLFVTSDTRIQGIHHDSAFNLENGLLSGYYIGNKESVTVCDGGVIADVSVHASDYMGSRGSLVISSGGFASNVDNGGNFVVSSGGSAKDIHGTVEVLDGGFVEKLSGGGIISCGGTADNILAYRGLYISSGGTATNIKEEVAYVSAAEGATVTFTPYAFSGAHWSSWVTLHSGTTAVSCAVSSGGRLYVYNGGSADYTKLQGYLDISSGGIMTHTSAYYWWGGSFINVYAGGFMDQTELYHGSMSVSGTVKNTTVYAASVYIGSGGMAEDTSIVGNGSSDGSVHIYNGGVANNTTVGSKGYLYVSSGGSANNTVINGGYLGTEAGASMNGTIINSGGRVYVGCWPHTYTFSGGAVNNTVINTGGSMMISSGGRVSGSLQIESGATVSAYQGAIIDFTVSEQENPETALINNWSLISGGTDATYTLTVKPDQAEGTYQLAGNAAGFNKTVTIKTSDTELGTISVGETKSFVDTCYTLAQNDGNLELILQSVVVVEPVFVTGKFTGLGGVFQLDPDGTAKIWTAGSVLQLTGSVESTQWEIVGVGDFNGAGHDGVLWLEKSTGYVYMQYDMSSLDEISGKKNCLGVLEEGYTIKRTGDFSGSGIDGALLQGPAFGDRSISLNYGLPVWARENDGNTFNGWLGALVNTWQEWDTLKGDLNDSASINANNYQYEVVGVGDFNGDGRDDVMLQNTMPEFVNQDGVDYEITGSGDVFIFLTSDEEAIKAGAAPTVCYAGCATDGWEILGTGDFNADGIDDTLLGNGTDLAGWSMANGQRQEDFWFGTLTSDQELAGVSDFNNDGTDDLLIRSVSTDNLTAWTIENGKITGALAIV